MQQRDLSKIYYIEKEIQMWEAEIKSIEDASLISSPGFEGLPGGSFNPTSKQEVRTINKLTIEAEIRKLKDELEQTYNEIISWISTLDDSYMRQILYYRCAKAKSWAQVVDAMGYGTADGVRKTYERFVKKYFLKK